MMETINFMQDGYEEEGALPRPTPEIHTDNECMLMQLLKGMLPHTKRLAQYRMPIVFMHSEGKRTIFYKIHTSINPSDIFTKLVDHVTFQRLAPMMVTNMELIKMNE